tara:strand:- start:55 stop:723 length:669 start_codon:yes stop_codon:yes gene_type:complete
MQKWILSLLLLASPVMADPIKEDDYYTNHSMGCMLLQECTDDVKEITTLLDISSNYPNSASYYPVSNEFNRMLTSLNRVGVKVFLADEKYFPVGHRGVYHTVSNNFFLNKTFMSRPGTLMSVMRHEGWHAAQDCMAGTINNSLIAIILPEDQVPAMYQNIVKRTYMLQPGAIPWEKEAYWAGHTEGMTEKALSACAAGNMWNVYTPTPLTREYLVKEGYISK